jgi:uncharacterized repeat protein (TIGR01451 family)
MAEVSFSATDPDLTNNTTSTSTEVNTLADLIISKSDDPDPATIGEPLTYTLTITNAGPSDALGLALTDTLPAEVLFLSSVPSSPACEHTSGIVSCSFGSLSAGNTLVVKLQVSVVTTSTLPFINEAEIFSVTPDPDLSNNLDTEDTTSREEIPPSVDWILPVTNFERYDVFGENVSLMVNAIDNVAIERVVFQRWDAGTLQLVDIGEDFSPPYQLNFDTSVLNLRWNQIFADAFDTSGNSSPTRSKYIWLFRFQNIFLPTVFR